MWLSIDTKIYILSVLIGLIPVALVWVTVRLANKKPQKTEPDFKNEKYRVVQYEDRNYAIQKYSITYGVQHYRGIGREWVTLKRRYRDVTEAAAALDRLLIRKIIFPHQCQEYTTESYVQGNGFQPRPTGHPMPKCKPPKSE